MMWKKILIALMAVAGTFSVGYAFYNTRMNATSSLGLSATDKIYVGRYAGNEAIWDIIKINSDGSYLLAKTKGVGRYAICTPNTNNNVTTPSVSGTGVDINACTMDNLSPMYNAISQLSANLSLTTTESNHILQNIFVPQVDDMLPNGSFGLSNTSQFSFIGTDWANAYYVKGFIAPSNITSRKQIAIVLPQGEKNGGTSGYITELGSSLNNAPYITNVSGVVNGSLRERMLRPFMIVDMSNVVFALDANFSSSNLNVVTAMPVHAQGDGIEADAKKVRVLDSSYSIEFKGLKKNNKTVTKAMKDSVIDIDANASSGINHKVSVLIYDSTGSALKYYRVIGSASGNSNYQFDLAGLPIGEYKIAIVNEEVGTTKGISASSQISQKVNLSIVASHKISYNKQPESGASKGDYEVGKNVNEGQTVGKITVNPQGVMPLTYTVEANGDNTYENFEIDGLDSDNASSATSLNVKIKNGAPNLADGGLTAGTYKFCISAQDDNGYPTTPSTSDQTKVCTSFTVEKTALTIAFDDPNQTKKSVSDAATPWNETATAKPSDGVKITYSKVGGDIGLIDIDPDSGEITYKGNGSYGKVKIRATADDDPNSGNDNYNSAYTEKEIVIYSQVDGSVIPHANSSDANTPTFTTSDVNVKTGGTIGTIKGAPGTPDNVSSGTITYTYGIKSDGDGSFFTVNSGTGVITSKANLAVGSYHITVTVSDKWSTKEIPVTINVGVAASEDLQFYETKTSSKVINTKTVNFTDTNVSVFATVKGSSNSNPVKYEIKDGSTNVIEINSTSGAITIKGAGTVTIVATKKGVSGQADARAELTFTVKAGEQEFIYTDSTLKQELPKALNKYKAYEEVYAPNKTFQVYTTGNPAASTVTYKLKDGSPTDVIEVDPDGTIHILNASMSTQIGKVIVEATSHDPNGNYDDKTIELPITITKATQSVSFKEDPIYVASGKGSVTPVIESQDISSNAGGANVEDTKTLVSVSSTISKTIAKTTDGQTITYNYDKDGGIDIPIHVIKQGNRNYEKAEADGTIHIMGPDESILVVSDVGEVEYGEHFTIESLQDDSASVNVQYTFTVDDTTYITSPTVNGNMAEFDAIKITGSKKVTVTITRAADSEKPLSVKKQITVVPKPIEITIEDKEKYKGEENPELTYEDFSDQLVEWNGTRDVIQTKDIKLSTTAKTTSPAGDYPIKGDSAYLNKTYPNYTFTFEEGTLTIIEENIEDDWYHMETDDGEEYEGDWTNQDVNIVSDHDEYTKLSPDQSTWKNNFITITKEGNNEQSFWMKKDSGAITSAKKERIKIDKKAPKVKNIKAKDSNNRLQDIINKLSGGIFFKPGTSFEISTDDTNEKLEVSGTESIAYKIYKQDSDKTYGSPMKEDTLTVTNEKANITISETTGTYKVCVTPTDKAGNEGSESCHEVTLKKINVDDDGDGKPDFNDPDGDGCPDLNIKWKGDDGKWVVINGDRDYDGIPDLNIDRDGDGIPDLNLDTDGDGKPDLNLVILKKIDWKPTICVNADESKGIKEEYCTGTSVKPLINVDLNDDGIPDINIDMTGDMKADINISTDGEKANLNIVIITNWIPDKNYTYQKFAYDTMKDLIPLINIDTDGDGRPDINIDLNDDGIPDINIDVDHDNIPDTNIDSTGDGQPDVNVDIDGDGKPDENIIKITEWKPEHNVDDPFPYDTMEFEEKKELEDNGVIVEKPDGTFAANITLKVTDITKDKHLEVSEQAKELIGEQRVIQVFDVKLLENGIEIEPDGTLKVKIPVKSNIQNPSLLILNENGEYEKVEAVFEDGYLIYETDQLGQFTIIGDMVEQKPDDTDVEGSYYPGANMGGALTGDMTNVMLYMGMGCMALGLIFLLLFKRKQSEED